MDVLRITAGVVLIAAFSGSLLMRNTPVEAGTRAVLSSICGVQQAANGAALAVSSTTSKTVSLDDGHTALMDSMGPMHADMMKGMMADNFEIAFVCAMIPHHQGALDMARSALKFSKDPWITMFAQEIIVAQNREITEMQVWLERKPLK